MKNVDYFPGEPPTNPCVSMETAVKYREEEMKNLSLSIHSSKFSNLQLVNFNLIGFSCSRNCGWNKQQKLDKHTN